MNKEKISIYTYISTNLSLFYNPKMDLNIVLILVGIIVWLIIGYLISKVYFITQIKSHRKHAVTKSRDVVMWHVSEKMAPLLPDFPYHYKDLVFLWKWVDYVVFDGLHKWEVSEIVFLEIKTWQAQLNKNERLIRDCVARWDLAYDIYRIQH